MPILDDEDCSIIMSLARDLTGTKVNQTNHSVIVQNVIRRFSEVKCHNLEEYLSYVDSHDEEIAYLLSAVTIHTTSWFREPHALEVFESIVLTQQRQYKGDSPFRVLSIACSTGEEVYSIAAILERIRIANPDFSYVIEGWDIDPISLRTARVGSYDLKASESIPEKYRHFLGRGIDSTSSAAFSVHDQVKVRTNFRAINIMSTPVIDHSFHFIFCRNMLIYFESEDVQKIVTFINSCIATNGYFCTGVSETSAIKSDDFKSMRHAVYSKSPKTNLDHKKLASEKDKHLPQSNGKSAILVVEDDPDIRLFMVEMLTEEGYSVLAAENAKEAEIAVATHAIELIFSDFNMAPGKNGIDLCRTLRERGYTGRFLIVSGYADRRMVNSALPIGCDDVIMKPFKAEDVIRTTNYYIGSPRPKGASVKPDLILLGASTGGTEVLAKLVNTLPNDCPPLMIVQHITSGFALDFAQRLAKLSGLKLGNMTHQEQILPGRIYAPYGDYHIGVKQVGRRLELIINNEPPINSHRPSVDFLFSSAALTDQNIFAAIFTGMGRDGASGLLQLKNQGATTFAQNSESCVVFGMPREAIKLNAANHICSPDEIRKNLLDAISKSSSKKAA